MKQFTRRNALQILIFREVLKMYIRKTKDIYILFWNGEEIDTAETLKEALYLQKEYRAAYGGDVFFVQRRVKK